MIPYCHQILKLTHIIYSIASESLSPVVRRLIPARVHPLLQKDILQFYSLNAFTEAKKEGVVNCNPYAVFSCLDVVRNINEFMALLKALKQNRQCNEIHLYFMGHNLRADVNTNKYN